MEHQESYLQTVLGFFGVTDVRFVRAEGVAMGDAAKAPIWSVFQACSCCTVSMGRLRG
jgi:FMN-dependent NADH-azoreductase